MRRKWVICFVVALLSVLLLPMVASYWVRGLLEQSLKTEIHARVLPVPATTQFFLKDASLDWGEKVKLVSGDLKVTYFPLRLLRGEPLVVEIYGENLNVVLLGEWAKEYNVEQVMFRVVDFKFALGEQGFQRIYRFKADSPIIKLSIEESSSYSR